MTKSFKWIKLLICLNLSIYLITNWINGYFCDLLHHIMDIDTPNPNPSWKQENNIKPQHIKSILQSDSWKDQKDMNQIIQKCRLCYSQIFWLDYSQGKDIKNTILIPAYMGKASIGTHSPQNRHATFWKLAKWVKCKRWSVYSSIFWDTFSLFFPEKIQLKRSLILLVYDLQSDCSTLELHRLS